MDGTQIPLEVTRTPKTQCDDGVAKVIVAWGRALSIDNAIEAGTWCQGDSGWAEAGRPGGAAGGCLPPFQCIEDYR